MPLQLLIVMNHGDQLVCGPDLQLPQLDVPVHVRAAWYLTRELRDRWHLDAVCLAIDQRQIAWVEVVGPDTALPSEYRWTNRSDVGDPTVQSALQEMEEYRLGRRSGPFARIGWLREFYARVEPHLPSGARFSGRFEQWNPGPQFCLARFDLMPQGSVWLKAVGEPALREHALVPVLAARHPSLFPRVVASVPEWDALLLEHVDALGLHEQTDPEGWCCAAAALAMLQVSWQPDVSRLLNLGCSDCRLERLDEFIPPFFNAMEQVCETQTSTKASRLEREDLVEIARAARVACARLTKLAIPASLGHGDLGPQNVLYRAGRVVFLDWAAGCVGHPFLTFEAFRYRFSRQTGGNGTVVVDAYAAVWKRACAPEAVDEALQLARLVAPLQCAFLCATENGTIALDEHRHRLYRSLVRVMRETLAESLV
jgi:hypothetical protein